MKFEGWENEDVVNQLNQGWNSSKYDKHRPKMYELVKHHYKPGMSILDAGCGTGVDCPELFTISNKIYLGVDISDTMLKQAAKNCPGIKFIHADVTGDMFPDNFADIVFCNDLIRHVRYWKKSLKNIIRVAKVAVILSANLTVGETRNISDQVCGIKFPDKAYNIDEFSKFIEGLGCKCSIFLSYDFEGENSFASKYVVEVLK